MYWILRELFEEGEIKARGMPSPDRADAVMMSLSESPVLEMEAERNAETEYAQTLTGDLLSRKF